MTPARPPREGGDRTPEVGVGWGSESDEKRSSSFGKSGTRLRRPGRFPPDGDDVVHHPRGRWGYGNGQRGEGIDSMRTGGARSEFDGAGAITLVSLRRIEVLSRRFRAMRRALMGIGLRGQAFVVALPIWPGVRGAGFVMGRTSRVLRGRVPIGIPVVVARMDGALLGRIPIGGGGFMMCGVDGAVWVGVRAGRAFVMDRMDRIPGGRGFCR